MLVTGLSQKIFFNGNSVEKAGAHSNFLPILLTTPYTAI